MIRQLPLLYILLLLNVTFLIGQSTEEVVDQLKKEATENSQLEQLAHELMDVIGPRLVGTPQMTKAHD
ncbi:MAG: peptidase M28, partial [Eudoraea sp.]